MSTKSSKGKNQMPNMSKNGMMPGKMPKQAIMITIMKAKVAPTKKKGKK